eukprot:11200626-Lingulodinium_polyedra.AAC.1
MARCPDGRPVAPEAVGRQGGPHVAEAHLAPASGLPRAGGGPRPRHGGLARPLGRRCDQRRRGTGLGAR